MLKSNLWRKGLDGKDSNTTIRKSNTGKGVDKATFTLNTGKGVDKATFILSTDARPRTFSVRPSRQNRTYRTRSDTAVDAEQNGPHEAKKVDPVVVVEA